MSDREMMEETKKEDPVSVENAAQEDQITEVPADETVGQNAEQPSGGNTAEQSPQMQTESVPQEADQQPDDTAAQGQEAEPENEKSETLGADQAETAEAEHEPVHRTRSERSSGTHRSRQPERPKKDHQASQRDNILRLREIKKKKAAMPYMKILAAGGTAVAIVAVVAVAGTMIKNHKDAFGGMKVETAAASLETTEAASESGEEKNIVLETTLSAEEIESKEFEKTVQSIVDSYANLGIAEVSGYLNVRKTPESFGEVVGKLPKGGACEILDTSTEGWYKISSGGVTGYVSSQYVYTGDEAKKLAAENVAERAVIDADKLNVRSEPKADADVVDQVFKNERYDIKSQQDGWIQVSDGYISADYVTVKYALDEAIKQDMRQTVLSLYDNLGVSNVSNYLNVRDNPDETKGKIIAKLPSNAGCDILDTSTAGWLKIRSGNITGYVKSEYILTGQQAKDKALQVAKLMAISNTDGVNVRTEPNTNSSIYTQISNSERFLVADQQDGWVKIEIDDQDAYLSSDYVRRSSTHRLLKLRIHLTVRAIRRTAPERAVPAPRVAERRAVQMTERPDRSPEAFPPSVRRSQTMRYSSSETAMYTAERA